MKVVRARTGEWELGSLGEWCSSGEGEGGRRKTIVVRHEVKLREFKYF